MCVLGIIWCTQYRMQNQRPTSRVQQFRASALDALFFQDRIQQSQIIGVEIIEILC